jgi:hypothetical protein
MLRSGCSPEVSSRVSSAARASSDAMGAMGPASPPSEATHWATLPLTDRRRLEERLTREGGGRKRR